MASGWIRDVDAPVGLETGAEGEMEAPQAGDAGRGPVRLAPRTQVEADGRRAEPPGPGFSEPARDPTAVPAPSFAAPLFLLLAGLATLEGYSWLNVISTDRWRSWAVFLAVLTVGAVIVLVRPLRHDRRLTSRLLLCVSLLMLATTVLAALVKSPAAAGWPGRPISCWQ